MAGFWGPFCGLKSAVPVAMRRCGLEGLAGFWGPFCGLKSAVPVAMRA